MRSTPARFPMPCARVLPASSPSRWRSPARGRCPRRGRKGSPTACRTHWGRNTASRPTRSARQRRPPRDRTLRGMVRHWNEIAIDASGLDHTPVAAGEPRIFGEQLGPGAREPRDGDRAHRGLRGGQRDRCGGYQSYVGLPPAVPGTSLDAAIAQAAHDTLVALFPSQRGGLRRAARGRPRRDPQRPRAKASGHRRSGGAPPAAILALRANDGSEHAEPRVGVEYLPSTASGLLAPGSGQPGPARARRALGRGAAVRDGERRAVPRAAAAGARQRRRTRTAYDEVQRLGGDGVVTPTERTAEQTHDRASSGPTTARRACARRRACTTRSRCRSPTSMGSDVRRARAAARARQRRDGRRGHRDLGVEVPLRALAAGHRHPRADPDRPDGRRRQPGDRRRPDLHAAGRAGQQPRRPQLHAAVPGLSVRSRRLRRRAVPDAARASTAPTTSPSPSCPTSSTA